MSTPTINELYQAWLQAEFDEQAALVLLGVRDDVETRAAAELASERRDAAAEAYRAAANGASSATASS